MKKYLILILSLLSAACSSYETRNDKESQETVYAFFFAADNKEKLYLLGEQRDYLFTGADVAKLAAFLDTAYARQIVKVEPAMQFETDNKQTLKGYYEVVIHDQGLTDRQKDELKKGKYGVYIPLSPARQAILRQDHNLASHTAVYRTEYRAYGKPVKFENRTAVLSEYKLAKPLSVPVTHTYYTTKTEIDEEGVVENVLGIVTAPVWIPAALLLCLGGRSSFIDVCIFR